jgi:hypothetical protein
MATITEMKIACDASNEPMESMSCRRMKTTIKNMKALGLFDMIEYKYIKNVIDKDKSQITIWIETKQVTNHQKMTSFTFNLQYDELNVKSVKVTRPYANGSWFQNAVIQLVVIGKEQEDDSSTESDED